MFSTIKIAAAVAFLAAGASAQSTTAPVVTNNPQGAAYIATLVPTSKSNITGNVLALTSSDKVGVNFQIALTGLPSEGGPFRMSIELLYTHLSSANQAFISVPHPRQPHPCGWQLHRRRRSR